MAKKRYDDEPIATYANIETYRQPTVTQQPQYGLDSPQTMANMEKLQQNYGITPNPVTQTGGGAMTANGISAGNSNVMTQTPSGMMGVRNELNNRGIYDIGWDDTSKTYTVGGQQYKPGAVQDGVSYDSEQNINKITNDYYRQQGKPLEGADAYVAQQLGVKNAVTWSDGNLMVGGQLVPTVYVDKNGTAYAQKSALDAAINAYRNSTGLTGNQNVVDDWNSRYGNKINSALNKVLNRKEWSYNPEDDAAYRSYRDQYTREGDRAYQNAYADMAANTGGYGSSAAMNAAGQQWNYYMQQLGDRIPELQQNDYNRYLGEYELRQNALNSLRNVANDDYNKEYQANRDIINDLNAANEASYQRRLDARDRNRSDYDKDRLWEYEKELYADKVAQSAMDTERYGRIADLNLESAQYDTDMKRIARDESYAQWKLQQLGYSGDVDAPVSEDIARTFNLSAKEDGTYPTFRQMIQSMAQVDAETAKVLWEAVTKPQTYETWYLNNYGMWPQ